MTRESLCCLNTVSHEPNHIVCMGGGGGGGGGRRYLSILSLVPFFGWYAMQNNSMCYKMYKAIYKCIAYCAKQMNLVSPS